MSQEKDLNGSFQLLLGNATTTNFMGNYRVNSLVRQCQARFKKGVIDYTGSSAVAQLSYKDFLAISHNSKLKFKSQNDILKVRTYFEQHGDRVSSAEFMRLLEPVVRTEGGFFVVHFEDGQRKSAPTQIRFLKKDQTSPQLEAVHQSIVQQNAQTLPERDASAQSLPKVERRASNNLRIGARINTEQIAPQDTSPHVRHRIKSQEVLFKQLYDKDFEVEVFLELKKAQVPSQKLQELVALHEELDITARGNVERWRFLSHANGLENLALQTVAQKNAVYRAIDACSVGPVANVQLAKLTHFIRAYRDFENSQIQVDKKKLQLIENEFGRFRLTAQQKQKILTKLKKDCLRRFGAPSAAFYIFAGTGQQHITYADFLQTLRRLGIWGGDEGVVREIFNEFDKDSDTFLSYMEFESLFDVSTEISQLKLNAPLQTQDIQLAQQQLISPSATQQQPRMQNSYYSFKAHNLSPNKNLIDNFSPLYSDYTRPEEREPVYSKEFLQHTRRNPVARRAVKLAELEFTRSRLDILPSDTNNDFVYGFKNQDSQSVAMLINNKFGLEFLQKRKEMQKRINQSLDIHKKLEEEKRNIPNRSESLRRKHIYQQLNCTTENIWKLNHFKSAQGRHTRALTQITPTTLQATAPINNQ